MRSKTKSAVPAKPAAANHAHITKAGLAADSAQHQSDRKHGHGASAPPDIPANGKKKKKYKKRTLDLVSLHERLTHRVGLIDKREILLITGVSFPTVWDWMRKKPPKFPRNRAVAGKSKWLAADIADWLDGLPLRPLKGDAPSDQKIEEHEPA